MDIKFSLIHIYLCSLLLLLEVPFHAKAQDERQSAERFKSFAKDCGQTLDSEQTRDLMELREFVSRATDTGSLKFPTDPLTAFSVETGIENLMFHRQEKFTNSRKGRKEYEAKFEEHVRGRCDALNMKLKPVIDDYRYIMKNINALRYLDANSLEWLEISRICSDILANSKRYCTKGYDWAIGPHYTTGQKIVLYPLAVGLGLVGVGK